MKVLYFLPGTGVGGIGKFVRDMVSQTKDKVDYTFVTLGNPNTELALFLKENGKFINYSGWSVAVLKGVYDELRQTKYDVVHAHLGCWSFIILGIAKVCRVKKRVAHSHSADSFKTMNGIGKLISLLSFIINPLTVTNYLACSDHACECTFGKKVLISDKYARVLNPVDERYFEDSKDLYFRNEVGIPQTAKVVCHVGYMGYHKNHMFILNLAQEMRNEDVYWVLVGDGNKRSEFETYAKTNRLEKAVFVGLRNDIPSILDESDLFILPSILEGLGTVVLEAQARGKKCIISENVTNEVDMKLGLVKKVMLSNVNAWKQEILSNHIVDLSLDEIKNTFVDRKVEISACAEYLLSLYR